MKTFNKKIILLLILVICFLACKKATTEKDIWADNYIVSTKNPIKKNNERIVSVSPQVTEILCELGCQDRIVGRTDFCVYPPSVKKIPSIGGINNANIEKIISLNPDIVITSSIFSKKMFVTVENANIPIMSFKEGKTINQMYNVISILGKITSKREKADSLIANCKERLAKVQHQTDSLLNTKKVAKPKVYYVVGFGASGDYSAGKDTYINQIITLSGGYNIASISSSWSFNKEELFKNQPDYIFIRDEDLATFIKTPPYTKLDAVKKHKVYPISTLDTQTPRSIDAIEYIFKTIYNL